MHYHAASVRCEYPLPEGTPEWAKDYGNFGCRQDIPPYCKITAEGVLMNWPAFGEWHRVPYTGPVEFYTGRTVDSGTPSRNLEWLSFRGAFVDGYLVKLELIEHVVRSTKDFLPIP